MKTRKLLPDVMRGFAAILVVLGHCIQECGGLEMRVCQYYWYSKPYQFIYSFHMPFFMLLTGYFAATGFSRAQKSFAFLRRRVLACLVPVFAMTALDFLRLFIEAKVKGVGLPYENIGDFFKTAYYSLWFLWAVAIFYIMVFIVNSTVGKLSFVWEFLVYILIFLLLFVITDDYNFHVYKFVYPFFVMGYTYYRYEDKIKAVYEKRKEA
ncbi:MAG: acyltransferase [Lachnospiraceae bacterium]|nr:acyltransferase [Lachnospiraceae bacterium]